jgi:membrane fusion protein, multidrug efflux system
MSRRIAIVLALVACSKTDAPAADAKGAHKLEYPVEVAPLVIRQVQYSVTAPGSLDAFQQVQITARVAGAVDKVQFTEGQVVKEGQVLVTIESARYLIAVEQAKAVQARAEAMQRAAEAELARRKAATEKNPGLITGEEIETKTTAVETAKADVLAAQEQLHVANLNLSDSFVRAPIAGVVQTRTVQMGQYLTPGAVLATILQRDPMLLRFQVSEQDAPRLKPGMEADATLRESTRIYKSKITLVSGAADPQTRLVPVTAEIEDTDHQYWLRPGAFCEVTVPVGDARKGIVVPTMAVQPTEKGNVVYVVDAKNVAHSRLIETGMHTPDGNVEVTRGLTEGEELVVRGMAPLSDGAPVKITLHTTLDAIHGGDGGTDDPNAVPTTDAPPQGGGGGGPDGGHKHKAAP